MKLPKLFKKNPAPKSLVISQQAVEPTDKLEAKLKKANEATDSPKGTSDGFDPTGDEKASEWDTMTTLNKVVATGISGWWGLVLGGTALLATTAMAPLVAAGIGAAAGIAVGQAATRLHKMDTTKAQAAEAKEQRAQEPSSWKTSSTSDKAKALGLSGWLGASVIGIGLGMAGVLAPVVALAVGAGIGMSAGAGAMMASKDSDRSSGGHTSSSDDSSGIALTTDGKLGFSMGGGVVLGADGKVGFGFDL